MNIALNSVMIFWRRKEKNGLFGFGGGVFIIID